MKKHANRIKGRPGKMSVTARRANHEHNPAGTKLIRKCYKQVFGRKEKPEIMVAGLAGYHAQMEAAYNKYMWANRTSYMDRKNKGIQAIHGE